MMNTCSQYECNSEQPVINDAVGVEKHRCFQLEAIRKNCFLLVTAMKVQSLNLHTYSIFYNLIFPAQTYRLYAESPNVRINHVLYHVIMSATATDVKYGFRLHSKQTRKYIFICTILQCIVLA